MNGNSAVKCDVAGIGAGPAGLSFARSLAETGLDIALALTAQGPLAEIGERFAGVMQQLRWSQNQNSTAVNSTRSVTGARSSRASP